jgi:hypothetical protein
MDVLLDCGAFQQGFTYIPAAFHYSGTLGPRGEFKKKLV